MMKHYYLNEAEKQILVYDTKPDSIEHRYLGSSDYSNIKAQASMFVRGGVGYRILTINDPIS